MMRNRQTMGSVRTGTLRVALALAAAGALLSGCGGGSMFGFAGVGAVADRSLQEPVRRQAG